MVKETAKDTIGKRIRHEREYLGITQIALAKRLNVTRNTIANWEGDRVIPSVNDIKSIAEFLNLSVNFIITGDEPPSVTDDPQKHNSYSDPLAKYDNLTREVIYKLPLIDNSDKESLKDYVDHLIYKAEMKKKNKNK